VLITLVFTRLKMGKLSGHMGSVNHINAAENICSHNNLQLLTCMKLRKILAHSRQFIIGVVWFLALLVRAARVYYSIGE